MQRDDEDSKQVTEYARSLGLRVFPGIPLIGDESKGVVVWDPNSQDWKSFIEIAKEEGAKTVIVFSDREAKKNHSATLAWIKDGIVYLFGKGIDACLPTDTVENSDKETGSISLHSSPSLYSGVSRKSLKEIKKKSEDELVQEILQFAGKEFKDTKISSHEIIRLYWQRSGLGYGFIDDPDVSVKMEKVGYLAEEKLEDIQNASILSTSEEELARQLTKFLEDQDSKGLHSARAIDLFWDELGIRRYTPNSKLRLKMEKVNSIVQQDLQKKERGTVEKLLQQCLAWANENGLRKLTRSNIDYFLSEREVQLSKQSKDLLYTQANFKLGKSG